MAKPKLPLIFLFIIFSIFLCFSHCNSSQFIDLEDESLLNDEDDEVVKAEMGQKDTQKKCDFSYGKWVYDSSYPLYDPNCPYLSSTVTCQKNGRPDSDYQKWKWKPNGCYIPRYYCSLLKKKILQFVKILEIVHEGYNVQKKT